MRSSALKEIPEHCHAIGTEQSILIWAGTTAAQEWIMFSRTNGGTPTTSFSRDVTVPFDELKHFPLSNHQSSYSKPVGIAA